jgi:hypothetical integral membrane protein (TIGR02206 family)
MGEWFGSNAASSFHFFGIYHVLIIITFLLGVLFLLIYSNKQKTSNKQTQTLRWVFFVILVSSEISYQIWGIWNGTWNTREFLPFQLCSIAGILTMLALLTKNHKLIQILLFIGIVPSFLAVVTPELHHGYPHFRFWQFFIHHLVLSWASLYLVITSKITVTFKTTIEAYIYLLCYAAIMGFFLNPLFNANFLFLARIPTANTPLSLLGGGFWYYFNLCLVGLLVFILIYWFYRLINQLHRSKSSRTL